MNLVAIRYESVSLIQSNEKINKVYSSVQVLSLILAISLYIVRYYIFNKLSFGQGRCPCDSFVRSFVVNADHRLLWYVYYIHIPHIYKCTCYSSILLLHLFCVALFFFFFLIYSHSTVDLYSTSVIVISISHIYSHCSIVESMRFTYCIRFTR